MLFGAADLEALAARAPAMERLDTEPVTIEKAEVLQIVCEIASDGADSVLPPGLHPTIPRTLSWVVLRATGGPLGPFTLAQTRIGCRSGVRPRGFLLGAFVDSDEARAALAARWGFAVRKGTVQLRRGYDKITATVVAGGKTVLDLALADPDPLGADDVQITANMNLARTPRGLRLVQVDPEWRVARAERGHPEIVAFDGEAFGDARVRPVWPVSAAFAMTDVTLPKIRYLCRPDVTAFEGTETVDR